MRLLKAAFLAGLISPAGRAVSAGLGFRKVAPLAGSYIGTLKCDGFDETWRIYLTFSKKWEEDFIRAEDSHPCRGQLDR